MAAENLNKQFEQKLGDLFEASLPYRRGGFFEIQSQAFSDMVYDWIDSLPEKQRPVAETLALKNEYYSPDRTKHWVYSPEDGDVFRVPSKRPQPSFSGKGLAQTSP